LSDSTIWQQVNDLTTTNLATIAALFVSLVPQITIAATTSPPPSTMVNEPICHALMKGRFFNLNKLCGVQDILPMIDVKVDRDRDGVSDELLIAFQTQQKALAKARSTGEFEAADRAFAQRLPYSTEVRQMQAQQKNLRDLARREENFMKTMELMERANALQTQIEDDPSYKSVQAALKKVTQKLRRGNLSITALPK
jgi:hypothetical protein